MHDRTPPSTDPIAAALENLSAAGVSFTPVPRCPSPDCAPCSRIDLACAA
jgi:hypothetical protein